MAHHLVTTLLAAAVAVPGAAWAGPPPPEPATFLPAAVADAAGTVACLRTPERGVEAVDLASGRELWRSAAPSRALLVAGGLAFVLEERGQRRLQLSAYEPGTGLPAGTWAVALDLPGWASLAEPASGRTWTTFEVYALHSSGVLEVEYQARRLTALGIPPGRRVDAEVAGVLAVDLGSGRTEHRRGARLARPVLATPPPPGSRFHRFHARPADATLVLGGPPPDVEGVVVAGDERVGFGRTPDGRGVSVARWNAVTGARDPPLAIPADADAVWPTLDRRHVALRRARDQRLVDVHSLATGERIATLERPADIAVIGGRILWTTGSGQAELRLVSTEARSGRTLWTRTVWRAPPSSGEPIP
jgi:hypothetical protein